MGKPRKLRSSSHSDKEALKMVRALTASRASAPPASSPPPSAEDFSLPAVLPSLLDDQGWSEYKARAIDRIRRLTDQAITTFETALTDLDVEIALDAARDILSIVGLYSKNGTSSGPASAADREIPASLTVALMRAGAGLASMTDQDASPLSRMADSIERTVTSSQGGPLDVEKAPPFSLSTSETAPSPRKKPSH